MNFLKKKRIICGILLVLWMSLIFVMSAQYADKSSDLSDGLVSKVIEVIYPNFERLTVTQQSGITHISTFIVRKAAHFFEYFVLGVFGILTANTFNKYKFCTRVISAALFCVLYAVSDEIHQSFVPGRACRFTDVLIDSSGILTAIVIISLIMCNKKLGERSA